MNREHEPGHDLDDLLHDAFASRHVPLTDRPSMLDVQRRARRHTHRRSAAMVGCTAVVALGGAGLWAARQSGSGKDTVTAGDGGAPDATYCLPVTATTYPPTTIAFFEGTTTTMFGQESPTTAPITSPITIPPDSTVLVVGSDQPVGTTTTLGVNFLPDMSGVTIPPYASYTIQDGDIPAMVAAKFNVTVEELNAANIDTAGYDSFYVGLVIVVPTPAGAPATLPPVGTTPVPGAVGGGVQCFPNAPTEWHCTGPLGTDAEGRDVYQACEPAYEGWSTVTTAVVEGPVDTGTVAITMPPVTDLSPTTTSTIAILESTTSSLG